MAVIGAPMQLAADRHARRRVAGRNSSRQAFVAQAKGVFGLEVQAHLIAGFAPFQ